MSISNAMASGVSGLMANSKAVEKISYNIANADTVGYRRSFSQMVTSGSTSASGSFSTGVATRVTHSNTAEGGFMDTAVASNLTITGSGFFVVNSNIDASHTSGNMFTRVGSFEPDENGEIHPRWFPGNYSEYHEDRRERLGAAADIPKRIKYRQLTR